MRGGFTSSPWQARFLLSRHKQEKRGSLRGEKKQPPQQRLEPRPGLAGATAVLLPKLLKKQSTYQSGGILCSHAAKNLHSALLLGDAEVRATWQTPWLHDLIEDLSIEPEALLKIKRWPWFLEQINYYSGPHTLQRTRGQEREGESVEMRNKALRKWTKEGRQKRVGPKHCTTRTLQHIRK